MEERMQGVARHRARREARPPVRRLRRGQGDRVTHDGKVVGTADTGKGVDIIAYSAALAHLYVPRGDSATLTILGVHPGGKLDVLGSIAVAADSHCVAADDLGHAYVCDPKQGALLVVSDPYPAIR